MIYILSFLKPISMGCKNFPNSQLCYSTILDKIQHVPSVKTRKTYKDWQLYAKLNNWDLRGDAGQRERFLTDVTLTFPITPVLPKPKAFGGGNGQFWCPKDKVLGNLTKYGRQGHRPFVHRKWKEKGIRGLQYENKLFMRLHFLPSLHGQMLHACNNSFIPPLCWAQRKRELNLHCDDWPF